MAVKRLHAIVNIIFKSQLTAVWCQTVVITWRKHLHVKLVCSVDFPCIRWKACILNANKGVADVTMKTRTTIFFFKKTSVVTRPDNKPASFCSSVGRTEDVGSAIHDRPHWSQFNGTHAAEDSHLQRQLGSNWRRKDGRRTAQRNNESNRERGQRGSYQIKCQCLLYFIASVRFHFNEQCACAVTLLRFPQLLLLFSPAARLFNGCVQPLNL